jgi:hypothetical protein
VSGPTSGPTLAHAATKKVIRAYLEGGVELANDRVGHGGNLITTRSAPLLRFPRRSDRRP